MTTTHSFRDIIGDLNNPKVKHERRTDWAIAYLYRVPSTVFTWMFLRTGLSPVQISALGLVVSLAMPIVALWFPLWMAVWVICLCGVLFQILDCCDGTVARITGRTSILGADLDYFFGMIHYLCLYPSIGLLADRTFDTGLYWTVIATVAVAIRLLARLIRDQVALRKAPSEPGPAKLSNLPVAFLAGLSGLIPFVALTGALLGVGVIALLIYAILDVVDGALPLRDAPYRSDG